MGNLYFISALEVSPERIKIGYTRHNPFARLATLQTGAPVYLEMIGWLSGCHPADELKWHKRFAWDRSVGEWFFLTDKLKAAVYEALTWGGNTEVGDGYSRMFLGGNAYVHPSEASHG